MSAKLLLLLLSLAFTLDMVFGSFIARSDCICFAVHGDKALVCGADGNSYSNTCQASCMGTVSMIDSARLELCFTCHMSHIIWNARRLIMDQAPL
jgi:hypothetical protein